MRTRLLGHAAALAGLCMLAATAATAGPIGFQQINLTSNVPLVAPNTDPNLRNPWGMSFGPSSPFWVSGQRTGVATLYNAAGSPQPLVVTIPGGGAGIAGPTGQAFVGGQGFTMKNGGGSAAFVFATLQGTINAWNGGTTAVIQDTATNGAVYTGLTVANGHLYAADNENGHIDVYDTNFGLTTVSGNFVDPMLPAGFVPYNIQDIGGQLYVTYNMEGSTAGYVGIFDLNGNFIRQISDSHLESPWGLTLAPLAFGQFGGDLLVGNEDEGTINAFDPITGGFIGTLDDMSGHPIVNTGLWSLAFRAPGSGFNPDALFFTAGINDEEDGLFGEILPAAEAVPEPTPLVLVAFGVLGLAAARWRRRR